MNPRLVPSLAPVHLLRALLLALALALAATAVAPAVPALAAPKAPTGMKATASGPTTVAVSWQAVPHAVRYRVKYSTSSSWSNPSYTLFSSASGQVRALRPGTTYYVKVRVVSADNHALSAYSSSVKVTTGRGFRAPTGLAVTASGTDSVGLRWNKSGSGIRYRIRWATDAKLSDSSYKRVTDPAGTVTGLKPAKSYWFAVRVITGDGDNLSPYSTAIKVTTASVKPTGPAPAGTALRVASFNVRCANCLDARPLERTWYQRRDDVVRTILDQHPDVVGLQEASQGWLRDSAGAKVDLSQFEDLRNRLGGGWTLTNSNRNNCVKATTPTNCVYADRGASQGTKIIYNANSVTLIDQGSKALPSAESSNRRYLAWARFKQRSTGKEFFFADTHLEPNDDQGLHVAEAKALADEVAKRNTAHLPTLIVGDMNSHKHTQPSNGVYDVLVGQRHYIDPLGNTWYSTDPAGSRAPTQTVEKRVNTWLSSYNDFQRHAAGRPDRLNGTYLDYILTTAGLRVSEWETVAKVDAAGNFVGDLASDHNMVRATVVLP